MTLLIVGLIVGLLGLFVVLAYINVPMLAWFAYAALVLAIVHVPLWLWILFGLLAIIFNVPFIRQVVITAPIAKTIRLFKLLPAISETERAAIEAGTVWVDGELFSGKPNFKRILAEPYPTLSPHEQVFIDGPVEQVCRMATDWEIHQRKDFPDDVWAYLRKERFFGMMIPSEYGGLGFSNTAYSAIMTKLASRSFTYTATVGVTNSLGPAKLLLRYGTNEQKQRYLPKLAMGEEMPCFALTEPTAGSDAASLQSGGTVFKGKDGELYLRLNWQKRYITLGAIATLIGLAVRLRDPDNLLGKGVDVGITCVLVPANTPGVQLSHRHDPMGVPFYNSPISGRNVVLPASQIIGGVERAGQGWAMLMQSLAAGRGISFPATCTGIAKLVSRVTSAYSVVREQFGLSIGKFEGVEDPLARIGGLTYLMDAARLYTCGAVDQGEQPAVVSAIAKYQFTELSRHIINDGMDILGGAGICRGPRNLLANIYTATPIPITVEGANIITRSLMIYGQGAIRCHGYIVNEIDALEDNNIAAFDHAFWQHVGLVLRNLTRAKVLGWTHGHGVKPPARGETARYYQKLAWASATFAALSDLAMLTYGGRLKRHEKITGRFADMLSWMYLATATLRRFEAEGRREDDLPLVHWAMHHSLGQIQQALEGLLVNLKIPVLGGLMRATTLPWFRLNPIGVIPTDAQGHAVAQLLQSPDGRKHITKGLYVPIDAEQALGRLERAYQLSIVAMPIFKKIKTALRNGQLKITPPVGRVEAALRAGLITGAESDLATTAEQAQLDAIQVDAFTLAEYQHIGKEYIAEEITDL
ncbi:acyl-CoA dehydrogenase [Adonisia turfae]|uniref:Acyl-coenzyme A dehydrogenase n=1 Tax=Adonisia turfae CCMR0081 TaxID=2292702 RepID=A0A6M0RIT9_9CYAN|nr:acyl-CoA dehydrogenase [Adonisia turfae]NEZ55571.1 acyl-CoA dehydrogenase [Adonisia turfae CCMR0081]